MDIGITHIVEAYVLFHVTPVLEVLTPFIDYCDILTHFYACLQICKKRLLANVVCIQCQFFLFALMYCRYLATTHFEPTYARSAFPCFDEPQFKARFKMSIFRDRFHIALFNMPVINTEDAGFYMGTGLVSLLYS